MCWVFPSTYPSPSDQLALHLGGVPVATEVQEKGLPSELLAAKVKLATAGPPYNMGWEKDIGIDRNRKRAINRIQQFSSMYMYIHRNVNIHRPTHPVVMRCITEYSLDFAWLRGHPSDLIL